MTTATKTRKTALADLEALEAGWAQAKAARSALGGELKHKREAQAGLFSRRQQLIKRAPGLVDHLDNPLEPDKVIADLDREITKLGNLTELDARYAHA
jgi:hypothetical protein